MNVSKEVHYEGWLIKSPPTKRIWRARWRRRWFTLRQGEIPEQFCLEYYTDRNCRKLKGVIDLDQCEQVDCGLRLENRKQKFQFMFDIKTPKRTYYLAADSAEDMHDWVNCICQVCHLHDTKHSFNTVTHSDYSSSSHKLLGYFNNNVSQENNEEFCCFEEKKLQSQATESKHMYQNNKDLVYVNTEDNKSGALINERKTQPSTVNEREIDLKMEKKSDVSFSTSDGGVANSGSISKTTLENIKTTGKNLENVALKEIQSSEIFEHDSQPTSTTATTGPYIPISECFSGNVKHYRDDNNTITPLNNLDPKFYDTPRSHDNIGLNLTIDQSNSPKITNCNMQHTMRAKIQKTTNHRSDSDSESVFTDDEEWTHPLPLRDNFDRCARPSDSSVENESFIVTYSQRFSRRPGDIPNKSPVARPLVKNKKNLILDLTSKEKTSGELQLSDTENSSPGQRDLISVSEGSYDIPSSYPFSHSNIDQGFKKNLLSFKKNVSTTPSPELIDLKSNKELNPLLDVQTVPDQVNLNVLPYNTDTNVFQYDFLEMDNLPPVNRQLKPKTNNKDKVTSDVLEVGTPISNGTPPCVMDNKKNYKTSPKTSDVLPMNLLLSTKQKYTNDGLQSSSSLSPKPPSINRKLKPNVYKVGNYGATAQSRRSLSSTIPLNMCNKDKDNIETVNLSSHQLASNSAFAENIGNVSSIQSTSENLTLQPSVLEGDHKLQYFELDVANSPSINRQSVNVGNLCTQVTNRLGLSADTSARPPEVSGVVYNSVDFVKTEAFKRIREERKKESGGINK